MYENTKIYGPYLSKQDSRLRIITVDLTTKEKKTVSYPKYLMECYLDRYLEEDETIDHIDGNPLNNDLSNLRVLRRAKHCYLDTIRNNDCIVTCQYCGKPFVINGNSIRYRNRHQSGYFCSKHCSGLYGREIQLHKRNASIINHIIPSKYKVKSALDESLE